MLGERSNEAGMRQATDIPELPPEPLDPLKLVKSAKVSTAAQNLLKVTVLVHTWEEKLNPFHIPRIYSNKANIDVQMYVMYVNYKQCCR